MRGRRYKGKKVREDEGTRGRRYEGTKVRGGRRCEGINHLLLMH